jgi:hypothetical protein
MSKRRFLIAAIAASLLLACTDRPVKAAEGPAEERAGDAAPDKPAKNGRKKAGNDAGKKHAAQEFDNPVGKNFGDLDKDKNGFLAMDEVFGATPKRDTPERNAFEASDRDGNDWLTPPEFMLLQRIIVSGVDLTGKKGGGQGPANHRGKKNHGGKKGGKGKLK